ncbi:MAG: NADH-quinone oxidoreductase subunit G, partial [Actinomycetota bacterium]|nr:NADH-quinone oxidoreductase subunit G [Actinomycetota bacterium]
VWDSVGLPDAPARDTAAIVDAACTGAVGALVVGGVEPRDLGLPGIEEALAKTFVISLEVRESAVTQVADVVLPVAPPSEKVGTFVDWEGRLRPFEAALDTSAMSDHRVLDMLAAELGIFLETKTQTQIHAQLEQLGPWSGSRPGLTDAHAPTRTVAPGQLVLATWAPLLDKGRTQDGEPYLAGTAPVAVLRIGPADAGRLAVGDGDLVAVTTPRGSIRVPALVTADLVEGVVWLPTNSEGCDVRGVLGAHAGDPVTVTPVVSTVARTVPATEGAR